MSTFVTPISIDDTFVFVYVIKECNHGTNAMHFRLFTKTETAKYLLSGVIRDTLVFLLF